MTFEKKVNYFLEKIKKPINIMSMGFLYGVVPPGIEPGTPGFSVLCSTI